MRSLLNNCIYCINIFISKVSKLFSGRSFDKSGAQVDIFMNLVDNQILSADTILI